MLENVELDDEEEVNVELRIELHALPVSFFLCNSTHYLSFVSTVTSGVQVDGESLATAHAWVMTFAPDSEVRF